MHVPRRRGVASACAACLLLLSALAPVTCEVAEDSGAQAEIDELDLESLDSDDDEEDDVGESAEPEPVYTVDFDQDMPEELRLTRMNVCLAGASARMQSNAEAVSGLAAQLVDQRPGMSMEQATNSVFFTWMMTCYMNINDEDAKSAGEGNAEVLKDINLYEPNAQNKRNAQSASKRQWDFLVGVVKEHMGKMNGARKAQDKGQSQQGSGQRPVQEPPAPASGSKASILLLVVVFGIIGVVTIFLMRKEKEDREEKERKKSCKKDKKKSH
mmetsp:Transcript_48234/g.105265  ORF Transcript_48234/g.105265 Transcript_48234/m.105265 type:complete len:270 (-) Transcript_48234:115-924(-)